MTGCDEQEPGACRDHENCDRCEVLDPCPCCGLRLVDGQHVYPDGSAFRLGQQGSGA